MKQNLLSIILAAALLFPVTSWAQTKIHLKQADHLATRPVNNGTLDIIKGNVIFTHDNTTIYCDSAYINKKTNRLEAFGNVRMQIGSDILSGRRLKYNGDTKEAQLEPIE
jgi:lipopolysaccharide assembly outer membrane protein LptD (OstA)